MNPGIKSKTGHVILNIFTEKNKKEALAVSPVYATRKADYVEWKHCANEHGTCQCTGTVRYGAIGNHVKWDYVGRGACLASNRQVYKRYVILNGQRGFTGTEDSCKQLCQKHDKCRGINFVPSNKHCHLNVDSDASLSLLGSFIEMGIGSGPIVKSTFSSSDSRNSWTCWKANRTGKWSSPRWVQGQIKCQNSVFGDPYSGIGKKCECAAGFRG